MEEKPEKSLYVINDTNGQKHFQLDEVLVLWEEHFENHLNTSFEYDLNALDTFNLPHTGAGLPEPEISKDEIISSILKKKIEKAQLKLQLK